MYIYNINRLSKYLVFVYIVLLFPHITISQQVSQSSPFQYSNSSNNRDVYTAINFIDTNTQEIQTTFNLIENNPFNKLDYPELVKNNYGQPNKRYDLGGIPLNEIKIDGCNIVIRSGEDLAKNYDKLVGRNFYYASVSGNNLVVHYLFYLNVDDIVIGRSDVILIFNSAGKILHKLQGFDTNAREWGLTENCRYFSYAYGGILDESLNAFSTVGYKVIDLEENKTVAQEDFGYKFNEVRTGAVDNLITVAGFSLDYYYIFIDFTKKRKYKRILTNEELGLWKELTNEGLVLFKNNRNSNTFTLLKFDRDFKVEELK